MRNRGSVTIEASLVFPIFLFFVMSLYHMCYSRIADNIVYEAAIETAEYMAEYAYLDENNILLPTYKFQEYVDDKTIVSHYVDGGIQGISFIGTNPLDDEGYVVLKVQYKSKVSVPFLPGLSKMHSFEIRQKAYVGADETVDNDGDNNDSYVYVTDNRDVYHSTRMCTYLNLSIRADDVAGAEAGGYSICEICGYGDEKIVYVTDYGRRYHRDIKCSGLKRTVYRVKLSEVDGLGGCVRCTK